MRSFPHMICFALVLLACQFGCGAAECITSDGQFGQQTVTAFQKYLNVHSESGRSCPVTGDFGPESIKSLQMLLNRNDCGAGLIVDGDRGHLTVSSLQLVLTEHGHVIPDGDWGVMSNSTIRALQLFLNSNGAHINVDSRPTLDSVTVKALQMFLNSNGGHVVVDGDWGSETTKSLQQYLNDHVGLLVDGDFGTCTKCALQELLNKEGFQIPVDGDFGSITVTALQDLLNRNATAVARPLDSYPNALCLDGTFGRYYIRPGFGDGSSKFIVFHEGGGFCTDDNDCVDRAVNNIFNLGSTKNDPDNMCRNEPFLNNDPTENPLLWNWNHVFVRYCDGGYYSGARDGPVTVGEHVIHYKGQHITEAVISDLYTYYALSSASDIVLSGCSAGGIRTFAHLDALRAMLPASARVVGFPDSGFYLNRPIFTPLKKFVVAHGGQNATAMLNRACLAAVPPDQKEQCLVAEVASPYIQTPIFAAQSRYDTDQRGCEMNKSCADSPSCIGAYGEALTLSVDRALLRNPQNSVFLDSCSRHCFPNGLPSDDTTGKNPMQAFADWYAGKGRKSYGQQTTYPCQTCCNAGSKANQVELLPKVEALTVDEYGSSSATPFQLVLP